MSIFVDGYLAAELVLSVGIVSSVTFRMSSRRDSFLSFHSVTKTSVQNMSVESCGNKGNNKNH